MDAMLLDGATMEQMRAKRGAVEQHLYHLKTEHDLPAVRQGNKYIFDRAAL